MHMAGGVCSLRQPGAPAAKHPTLKRAPCSLLKTAMPAPPPRLLPPPLIPWQNVLLAEGGLLKIADLGVSQVLDHVFTRVLVSSLGVGGPGQSGARL